MAVHSHGIHTHKTKIVLNTHTHEMKFPRIAEANLLLLLFDVQDSTMFLVHTSELDRRGGGGKQEAVSEI